MSSTIQLKGELRANLTPCFFFGNIYLFPCKETLLKI